MLLLQFINSLITGSMDPHILVGVWRTMGSCRIGKFLALSFMCSHSSVCLTVLYTIKSGIIFIIITQHAIDSIAHINFSKIHFLAILFTAHAQMLSPPLCTPGNLVSQDSKFLILVVDCWIHAGLRLNYTAFVILFDSCLYPISLCAAFMVVWFCYKMCIRPFSTRHFEVMFTKWINEYTHLLT